MKFLHRVFGRFWGMIRPLIVASVAYALIAYGAWLVYTPLGYIVAGLCLLALELQTYMQGQRGG